MDGLFVGLNKPDRITHTLCLMPYLAIQANKALLYGIINDKTKTDHIHIHYRIMSKPNEYKLS